MARPTKRSKDFGGATFMPAEARPAPALPVTPYPRAARAAGLKEIEEFEDVDAAAAAAGVDVPAARRAVDEADAVLIDVVGDVDAVENVLQKLAHLTILPHSPLS